MPPPRFELALRRTLFFLILVVLYLLLGTLAFSCFGDDQYSKTSVEKAARIDVKRAELLNVLWAETIAKSENDWAELANQKLEIYEKALLAGASTQLREPRSFTNSLQRAFAIITTIGPIRESSLSQWGKLFAISYAMLGIPLALLYLGQCGRMANTIFSGNRIFLPVVVMIFIGAIVFDIIEEGSDDTPFVDAIFSVFLQFTTIGEVDAKVRGIPAFILCAVGMSLMSVAFVIVQHNIERQIHFFELSFTKMIGSLTRKLSSSEREDTIAEEDEEEEADYD